MNRHRSNPHARRRAFPALALILGGLAFLPACRSSGPSATPMLDTRNPALTVNQRVAAAEQAWDNARGDPDAREKSRAVFKSLVWSTETPRPLRHKLVDLLLSDESPEGLADSRSFTMLRLPTEPDRAVVGMMALAAATHGWTDAAPSLVRRLAEPIDDIPDHERVEALALQRLHPGRSLERIIFEYFADPRVPEQAREIGWATRVQTDAWMLLSRLDPEGDRRRRLIDDPGEAALGPSGPILKDLRAASVDLAVIPSTAMELDWLRALRKPGNAHNTTWWGEVSSIVARLDDAQRRGLALRHLEPIRLASIKRPALLQTSRETLLDTLRERLRGRTVNRRTADLDGHSANIRERLADSQDRLSWGDLLSIIMIDDAIRTTPVVRAIFTQAELDRNDKTTEYGGVLEIFASPDGKAGEPRVVLFPPRPRDRVNDNHFVASTDMIEYSDRALAHYHLHAQRVKNYQYAGPSSGDLRYAALSGRNCIVITSLAAGRMGVDYYQPDGVVIDLGEITAPQ